MTNKEIAKTFQFLGKIMEWGGTVLIDRENYDKNFKLLEHRYDEKGGRDRIEVVIPQSLFPLLNQFPRVIKPR